MGFYNDLTLGDTDAEPFSDEGWHVDDRRAPRNVPQPIDTPPAHDTPALDHAVAAALERLAETEARAARQARTRGETKEAAYFQRAVNAYVKALGYWLAGIRPTQTPNGWLLPSQRPGEAPHKLTLDGGWVCTCPSGEHIHWASALIVGIEVGHDDLEQLGGETETPPPPPEPTPILVTTTPAGLTLSRGDAIELVTSPAEVAQAIGRLASPAARMGQRLALARNAPQYL